MCATHLAKFTLQDRTIDKIEFHIGIWLHLCLVPRYFAGGKGNTMNSPIGRCLTFNATASGYMRGDGCSGLTLKSGAPFEEQESVWRGSMCGQNGRSATLTAPNGLAQEDVIWKAIREAGTTPPEATGWSCHGTGTSLGDPIEVGGVRKVQVKATRETQLVVNTNKTNTGHLEGGAAMTSLVAAVIQLKAGKSNPTLHLGVLNPHLEGTDFGGYYNTELGSTNQMQSHLHISSFGFGGTNTHAVLFGDASFTGDDSTMFMKRLSLMAPPEVKPTGKDPSEWETNGLEFVASQGDKYSITITKDDAFDKPAKYVLEQEALGPDFDPNDTSYDICFNDGEQLTMEPGDVPGMRSVIVEVPTSGELEFNFVATMEEGLILSPATNRCKRKTASISGPAEGLTNNWLITETPDTLMEINLFTSRGMIAVSWLPAEL